MSTEIEGTGGLYLSNCKRFHSLSVCDNRKEQEKLWDFTMNSLKTMLERVNETF